METLREYPRLQKEMWGFKAGCEESGGRQGECKGGGGCVRFRFRKRRGFKYHVESGLEWVENGPRLILSKGSTITTPPGAYGRALLAELIEILDTVNYASRWTVGGETGAALHWQLNAEDMLR